jgi:hypothetical protein
MSFEEQAQIRAKMQQLFKKVFIAACGFLILSFFFSRKPHTAYTINNGKLVPLPHDYLYNIANRQQYPYNPPPPSQYTPQNNYQPGSQYYPNPTYQQQQQGQQYYQPPQQGQYYPNNATSAAYRPNPS